MHFQPCIEIFKKKKIVNYIIYLYNILFNRKKAFSKISTKHNFIQHNHFLSKVSIFYQMHYFRQNVFLRIHSNGNALFILKVENPNTAFGQI